MKHAHAAILLAAALMPVPASAMTLGEWLARDAALALQGRVDPESAEFKALGREVTDALAAARAADDAALAAGSPRAACLPPRGSGAQLTSREIGTWLYARPASERGESMAEAIAAFLRERFPCPA